jgi:peptidoglycan/xylan/chitin deacetylase (PgdA/CDA1 family)
MIHRTPFFLPYIYPSLTWKFPATEKELYLTFDDGPVNGPTEFVLETLHRHRIKATFFCIGDNVRKHPAVFKKIVDAGHSVGNHTFNHLNGWKTATAEYVKNVLLFDEHLPEGFGVKPVLFRPPYGRISFRQIRALSRYKIIMWDVLSGDFDKTLSVERCLRNSIKAVRPGSVIVFHDSYKAEQRLMYVLPRLIEHFLEQEYSFKSIPS